MDELLSTGRSPNVDKSLLHYGKQNGSFLSVAVWRAAHSGNPSPLPTLFVFIVSLCLGIIEAAHRLALAGRAGFGLGAVRTMFCRPVNFTTPIL